MKLLDRLSECLDSSAACDACLKQFRAADRMSRGSAAEHAADTLASLRELCSSHGIQLAEISDTEIACFVQEYNTTDNGYFCAAEYQDLVDKLAKYAALKARCHPRSRWALGVALSAAGAMAVSAVLPVAAAASTGLMVAAAPVGAAVGAVALSLDSRSMPRRDRRRAARHVPAKPKAAAAPAAAAIGATEQDITGVTAAPPATAEICFPQQDSSVLTAAPPAEIAAVATNAAEDSATLTAAVEPAPASAATNATDEDSAVLTAAALPEPVSAATTAAEEDSRVLTAAAAAAATPAAAETNAAEQDSPVLTAAVAATPAAAEINTAEQDSAVLTAAAPATPAAAEMSAAEQDSAVLAPAPAGPAEEPLTASSGSEELISAVVEVGPAAGSPPQADPKPFSLAAPAASAFAAAAGTAVEPAEPLLPALERCASPDTLGSTVEPAASSEDSVAQPGTPGSDVDAAAFDDALTAGLPPLALKAQGKDQKPVSGSKKLKKGLSKSLKSVKKAFSMNSSLRSSLDISSPNASITTPSNARPPLPASGAAAFLRRSFSRDSRDVAAVADKDASLAVQPSEGSATLRKMREALRRSFSVSTPRGGSRRASVDSVF